MPPKRRRHIVGNVVRVWPLVLPVVTGVLKADAFAILGEGLVPAFNKEFEDGLVVIVARLFPIADRGDERAESRYEIVSSPFGEFFRKIFRPRKHAGGSDLRFVGEGSGNEFSKLIAEMPTILFMRYADETV